MKIKQKVIACSLLLAFSGTLGVAAKTEITDIEYNGNTITVTATADGEKGTSVSFTLRKQNTVDISGTAAMLEHQLDAQKKVVFTVTVPDEKDGAATDGIYTVSVKAAQEEKDSETLTFVTSGKRAEKLLQLQGKTATELETALADTEVYNALKVMGVRVSMYDALCRAESTAGKDAFLTALCSGLPDCTDEGQLKDMANLELARATVNYGSAAEAETALNAVNPKYNETAYRDITDSALKTWICERIYADRIYNDYEALEKQYQLVNIYYELNGARSTDVADLLHNNSVLLELSGNTAYSTYSSYDSEKQVEVGAEFVQLVAENKIYSNTDVANRLKTAIDNANAPGGTSNGTVSGIQSNTTMSGSGGSGGYVASDKTDTTQQQGTTKKFQDLSDVAWAEEAINALADKGILNGVGDGRFEPNRTITREEFAKVLALAWGYEVADGDTAFTDVESGAWYAPYVAALTKTEIINGIGNGLFGVGEQLSRQDLAVLLYRVKGNTLTATRQWQEFTDYDTVGEYAKEAVKALYCAGCIDGMEDGTFRPEVACTRAEAAKMIYRILGQ